MKKLLNKLSEFIKSYYLIFRPLVDNFAQLIPTFFVRIRKQNYSQQGLLQPFPQRLLQYSICRISNSSYLY